MAIIDPQGRLFGKVSILDLGAALVIVLVIVGVFLFPGQNGSFAQINTESQNIEVDVIVRGLTVSRPEDFKADLESDEKISIVIRNQPAGEVQVKSVTILPRTVAVPQPDGSVKALPDPRPEVNYISDLLLTLGGNAQITNNGAVFGNNKVRVGSVLKLEARDYEFNSSVIDVRYEKDEAIAE